MEATKRIEFWAAIVLFGSFFLPWVTTPNRGMGGMDRMSLAGYQVADLFRWTAHEQAEEQERAARANAYSPYNSSYPYSQGYPSSNSSYSSPPPKTSTKDSARMGLERLTAFLIYAGAFMGLACAIFELSGHSVKIFYLLAALLPWLTLVLGCIYVAVETSGSSSSSSDTGELFSKFITCMSVGVWLTLLSTIALFVGVVRSKSARLGRMYGAPGMYPPAIP